jgi:hypothetical protein
MCRNGTEPELVIAPVAQTIVPSRVRIEGLAQPITSPKLAASQVALAPAAMSALIEAQEHMAGDATPTDRSDTAQKIDHILARLTDTPPAQPVAAAAQGDFSLQMLVAARRLLRETYALTETSQRG